MKFLWSWWILHLFRLNKAGGYDFETAMNLMYNYKIEILLL